MAECVTCGKVIEKGTYCSGACKQRAYRQKAKAEPVRVELPVELPAEVAALLVPASSLESLEDEPMELWRDSGNEHRGKRLNRQHPRIEATRTAQAKAQREAWLAGLTQRGPEELR